MATGCVCQGWAQPCEGSDMTPALVQRSKISTSISHQHQCMLLATIRQLVLPPPPSFFDSHGGCPRVCEGALSRTSKVAFNRGVSEVEFPECAREHSGLVGHWGLGEFPYFLDHVYASAALQW